MLARFRTSKSTTHPPILCRSRWASHRSHSWPNRGLLFGHETRFQELPLPNRSCLGQGCLCLVASQPWCPPWHHSWTASHSKRGGVSRGLPQLLAQNTTSFVTWSDLLMTAPSVPTFYLLWVVFISSRVAWWKLHPRVRQTSTWNSPPPNAVDDLRHWRETRGRELDGLPLLRFRTRWRTRSRTGSRTRSRTGSRTRQCCSPRTQLKHPSLSWVNQREQCPPLASSRNSWILTSVLLQHWHWHWCVAGKILPPPQTPPEPNPLDLLPPEPTLQESLCDDVKGELTCPITYEIMRDPVIDPEGNSYEKLAILAHLKKSQSSPVTRSPLTEEQLISNRALKQIIDAFTV